MEAHGDRASEVYACLQALYRRRRLAGAAFLITFSAALVYTIAVPPMYRATARLLIEDRNPRVVTFQEVIVERPRGQLQFSRTRHDMLRSRALARATMERLGLWDHPEFARVDDSPASGLLRVASRAGGAALSSIRAAILPPPPSGARGDAGARGESMAISRFMENLEIVAGRASRVVEIRFNARDPVLAADIANTLARVYIERDMEFRYMSSREASQWLRERIAAQRRDLEASERELQRYREEHNAAAIEDRQNIIVRELTDLGSAVTSATMSRIASETRYRDLEAAQDDPAALARFPQILENAFVHEQMLNITSLRRERVRLAEEFGPLHPDMVRIGSSIRDAQERLRNEAAAVIDSARHEYEAARSQEQHLLAEFDRQTEEALALDRTAIEYGVMKQEAESNRQLYESLLRRAAETSVTGELETTNIRVVDEAEAPVTPAQPRRTLVLLVGLFGATLLAGGCVLVVEHLGDAVERYRGPARPRAPAG